MKCLTQPAPKKIKNKFCHGDFLLEKCEYVSLSKLSFNDHSSSLIIAGTGMGKTTAVITELTRTFDAVIFVLPSTLKVKELEQAHRRKGNNSLIARYKFYYDNRSPTEHDIRNMYGLIVCTYDKFMKVDALLPAEKKRKSVVVVDECHKLYATGDYRDEALLPMICTLRKKEYRHTIYMTATFTQKRWDILDLPINQRFSFISNQVRKRHIEVLNYTQGDQYTFLEKVNERICKLKAETTDEQNRKKIFIRINNRNRCEMIANYLQTTYKFKCLVVHGKNKNDADVKKVFDDEKIPADVDVVLSTSILDEGINLNNLQGEIDSLFVIGKSAHPEELIQYLGRLRLATAPCFLVLHTDIKNDNMSKSSLTELQEKCEQKIDRLVKNVEKMADLIVEVDKDLAYLADDFISMFDSGLEENIRISSYYQARNKVIKLNATFINWVQAKLFGIYDNKITRNYPSLATFCYRVDMGECYANFAYLKYRLQLLDPHLTVTLQVDTTTKTAKRVKAYFREQEELNEQQLKASIDDAFELFLENHDVDINKTEPTEILPNIARFYSNAIEEDESYLQDLVIKKNVKHGKACLQNLMQIISLSRHLGNLHDIKDVLCHSDYKKVLSISQAYKDDLLVMYMLKYFKQRKLEIINNGSLKITPTEAQTYILRGFKQLSKKNKLPIETLIERKLIKGIKYDKWNNKLSIKDGLALNFIKNYFDTDDKNSHKPDKRYLMLNNLVYKNYHFIALDELLPRDDEILAPFNINGKFYDGKTGKLMTEILATATDKLELDHLCENVA